MTCERRRRSCSSASRRRSSVARLALIEPRERDPGAYDIPALARASKGLSGAEIEQAVVDAMYHAFPEDREFTTEDILHAVRETVPLSATQREKSASLRSWAKSRARWATKEEE